MSFHDHPAAPAELFEISALPRTLFYLVRHGETEWNRLQKIAGQQDVPLNDVGRRQAESVAAQLLAARADHPITHIVTSPLKRARETAAPIAAALEVPVTVLDPLKACAWGELEGEHPSRIDWRAWAESGFPRGMEHPDDFKRRMLYGLQEALQKAGTPLLVGHAEGWRVILTALGASGPTLSNGTVFVCRPPLKPQVPWFIYPLESNPHEENL